MRSTTLLAALAAAVIGASAVETTSAASPRGASPGAEDRVLTVPGACPTFTWEPVAGALFSQLVVYRRPAEGDELLAADLDAEDEVLYTEVPGGAGAWAPSADQCLEPGGRYVWFVRAVHETAGDEVVAASEWSPGRYFAVPSAPSAGEVRRALDVLRRWEASGQAPPTAPVTFGSASPRSPAGGGVPTVGRKSVPTAAAAIRGTHPDTSGEAYGVAGASASPAGAGLAAANSAGGPDLVLDGSLDGVPDTLITESGIYRTMAGDLTFELRNSSEGALNLEVGGRVSGDALEAGRLEIGGAMVIDAAGNWLGQGDTVPCTGCVGSADIADLSITAADIASDSVTSSKIADGAVGSSEIRDGGVATADLATGAVTTVKIATGAVSSAAILDGAVTGFDLAAAAVSTVHLNDWAVQTAKLATAAVTSAKIATGAVESSDILDGTITAADVSPTGGVYASKSAIYEITVTESVSSSFCDTATAACNDGNDLPLSWFCFGDPNNGLRPFELEPIDWMSASSPASFSCTYCNDSASTQSFEAHMICISVPGP